MSKPDESKRVFSPAVDRKLKALGMTLTRRDQEEKTETPVSVSATTEEKIEAITDQAVAAFPSFVERQGGDISKMNKFTLMRHIRALVFKIANDSRSIPDFGERKAAVERITEDLYSALRSR